MTRPMVNEVNLDKNINVTREMNDEEYAQYLIDQEAAKIELAKQAEKDAAAAAKAEAKKQALAALGLSQEIVNLLAE